ncbi:MAG: FliM/FliN family flagellar motor switch protein, partial [Planctomycetota bacterium]
AAPAAGRLAFEIAPSILHPVMEKLLGAPEGSSGDVPARPFTAIERRVAEGLVEIALGAAAEVLSRARPVELSLVQLESSPQAVPVSPPAEMAAVATFEMSIAGHSGAAHLAMPFGSFGGLLEELSSAGEVRPSAAAAGEGEAAAVHGAVGRVPVRLDAIAATLRMTLRELAGLSAGKEIATSRGGTGEVVVSVGGLDRFSATEGELGGRRAFRVASRLTGGGGR